MRPVEHSIRRHNSLQKVTGIPVAPIWQIAPALRALARGGVIAYPTEAVYGLGCRPDAAQAVVRLLQLKRRPPGKGLILVASGLDQLLNFVDFPDEETRQRVEATWPGPVTWLLPACRAVPDLLTGAHATLAVRVSAHPVVQALCRRAGPIVSTSANPAGASPARSAARVRSYFGRQLDAIVPGRPGGALQPTEIRDASGRILRSGG